MNTRDLAGTTDDRLRARARAAGTRGSEAAADDAMTRSEERLVAATEIVETGRARLRKYVVTEDVQITVQVRREELRLERESVPDGSQSLVEDPDVFGPMEVFGTPEGGPVFEVTLHEERPVIGTEIVPIERVRLVKVVRTEEQVLSGEVRKEKIEAVLPGQEPTVLE